MGSSLSSMAPTVSTEAFGLLNSLKSGSIYYHCWGVLRGKQALLSGMAMKNRSVSNTALEDPAAKLLTKSERKERQNKVTRNLFFFSILILILPLGTM